MKCVNCIVYGQEVRAEYLFDGNSVCIVHMIERRELRDGTSVHDLSDRESVDRSDSRTGTQTVGV